MAIGQVTISAADWLASRVSDRMALMAAGQKSHLVQQAAAAVEPADENTGALLDRRERERALLAAQDSYKRVAQRIKSRLANPLPPAEDARPRSTASSERAALIESLRDNPRLAATLIAAEQEDEAEARDQAASADAKEKEASGEAEAVFRTGLWDDLFVAEARKKD